MQSVRATQDSELLNLVVAEESKTQNLESENNMPERATETPRQARLGELKDPLRGTGNKDFLG